MANVEITLGGKVVTDQRSLEEGLAEVFEKVCIRTGKVNSGNKLFYLVCSQIKHDNRNENAFTRFIRIKSASVVPDTTTLEKITKLEAELAASRATLEKERKAAASLPKQTSKQVVDIPPPQTYANVVLATIRRAEHKRAEAAAKNRRAMAERSAAAAKVSVERNEARLLLKYGEGYMPLADRKKLEANLKKSRAGKDKARSIPQILASNARSFVRWSHEQMKAHQSEVLRKTGGSRWFSAAERIAFKAMSREDQATARAQVALAHQSRKDNSKKHWQNVRESKLRELDSRPPLHFGGLPPGGSAEKEVMRKFDLRPKCLHPSRRGARCVTCGDVCKHFVVNAAGTCSSCALAGVVKV